MALLPPPTRAVRLPAVALAVWLCAHVASPAAAQTREGGLDTLLMRSVTQFLSHDSLRGRATGTRGAELAARYIASACSSLGLAPLGGRFLHPVALARAVFDSARTRLTLSNAREERAFHVGTDFLPTGAVPATLAGFDGPAVFVGAQDDIVAGPRADLTGKVAVTSAPRLRAGAGDTLEARGAVGIVSLVPDDAARRFEEWSRGTRPLYLPRARASSFFPPLPAVAAWRGLSEALRDMARLTSPGALPWDLNVRIAVETSFRGRDVTGHNVACLIAGSDPEARDTAIVLTAHYDHLGVWQPDATGDSIYNGFSDNAAGVAMVLAAAKAAAARSVPLRHTLLFLFLTGEEKGLLGSDDFVAHPPWPLEEILGVVNLDAGAPPARPTAWEIAGGVGSPFGPLAAEVAGTRGWTTRNSAARPISDYYPFWRSGVPAILIIPGQGPYEGLSTEASRRLRARWDRYHQAGDEWSADFPFGGMARYATFAYLIVEALDGSGLPRDVGR